MLLVAIHSFLPTHMIRAWCRLVFICINFRLLIAVAKSTSWHEPLSNLDVAELRSQVTQVEKDVDAVAMKGLELEVAAKEGRV